MATKKGTDKKSLPWGLSHEGLKPGSMKSISENKLKAFSVGLMNTSLRKTAKVKQDIEEKKKKEEEDCAEVFADFVASFEDPRAKGKTFVRGNMIDPETKEESSSTQSGKTYKPMAKFSSAVMEQKIKNLEPSPKIEQKKKAKEKEKKKSNLELFKEELKRQQEEREIRHKIKKGDILDIPKDVLDNLPLKETDIYSTGSHDTGDPSTTNLYIGNINPAMNEEMLMRLFGKYGPLASVKIMWPRTEEEKSRNRNCGFVAYMRRKDGEKALTALKGKEIMSYEMKLGWGKGVPIPPHPIYIPPEMQESNKPPPPSGLPFNAQSDKKNETTQAGAAPGQEDAEGDNGDLDPNGFNQETLAKAVVKVVIPTERNLLGLIHRCVEFVVREGPMFEAMIMNREINNPMFRFLFDNQSPEHIYYRWRLFSILQGDSQTKWKTEKFKMFMIGSYWKPPPCHKFSMSAAAQAPARLSPLPPSLEPVDITPSSNSEGGVGGGGGGNGSSGSRKDTNAATSSTNNTMNASKKGMLSGRQRDRLEDLLREITPERSNIAECMAWCVDRADAADEVVQCVTESLSILETPLQVKVARLYLVSDILHNCSYKIPNMSFYRRGFQRSLPETFSHLNKVFKAINARMKAEQLRKQVMRCLNAWMEWAVYPPDFLENLESTFLGQPDRSTVDQSMGPADIEERVNKRVDDVDGIPLNIDGVPFGGDQSLDDVPFRGTKGDLDSVPLKSADIDGVPLRAVDIDGVPMGALDEQTKSRDSGVPHVASKWDQPEWERVQEIKPSSPHEQSPSRADEQSSADTAAARITEVDESRRKKLREIELKVAEYAQKLEAKGESNIAQQCNKYRAKLLEASEPKAKKKKVGRSRSASPSEHKRRSKSPPPPPPPPSSKKHRKHRSRSSSSSSSRSRSRSPLGTSLQSLKNYQSRSPSPSVSKRSRSRSKSASRGRSRSRSRTPPSSKHRKRKSRSRSLSPPKSKSSRKKRSRSRSRSPPKKKNKKKKK